MTDRVADLAAEKAKRCTQSPEHSEDRLAFEFTTASEASLRYVARQGAWYCWNGTRWAEDTTLGVFDMVRAHCREVARHCPDPRVKAQLETRKTASALHHLAQADQRTAATIDQWDRDPWLLNTPGGVVDLRTGETRPARPADYLTKVTAVTPHEGCSCSRFVRFLDEVTDGNCALQGFLQRMAGYVLTGVTREHALFFLYGLGANGKSVLLNTLTGIIGDYHRVAPIEMLLASKHDRHPTELAGLVGRRLVTAQAARRSRHRLDHDQQRADHAGLRGIKGRFGRRTRALPGGKGCGCPSAAPARKRGSDVRGGRNTGVGAMMAADIARALDPCLLMQDAGFTPDPWQAKLLTERPKRVLCCCARQTGKTETAVTLAEWTALYEPGSLTLIVSPSQRQSGEVFRRLMLLHSKLKDVPELVAESALRAEYANGSRVVALPGSEKTVRGYSRARLIILDEAARCPDELLAALRPTMAVADGSLIALSTPFGKRGWFYEAWSGGDVTWHRVKVSARNCPRLTQAFLDEELHELGPTMFRQEYELEFIDDAEAVFNSAVVARAFCGGVKPLWQ